MSGCDCPSAEPDVRALGAVREAWSPEADDAGRDSTFDWIDRVLADIDGDTGAEPDIPAKVPRDGAARHAEAMPKRTGQHATLLPRKPARIRPLPSTSQAERRPLGFGLDLHNIDAWCDAISWETINEGPAPGTPTGCLETTCGPPLQVLPRTTTGPELTLETGRLVLQQGYRGHGLYVEPPSSLASQWPAHRFQGGEGDWLFVDVGSNSWTANACDDLLPEARSWLVLAPRVVAAYDTAVVEGDCAWQLKVRYWIGISNNMALYPRTRDSTGSLPWYWSAHLGEASRAFSAIIGVDASTSSIAVVGDAGWWSACAEAYTVSYTCTGGIASWAGTDGALVGSGRSYKETEGQSGGFGVGIVLEREVHFTIGGRYDQHLVECYVRKGFRDAISGSLNVLLVQEYDWQPFGGDQTARAVWRRCVSPDSLVPVRTIMDELTAEFNRNKFVFNNALTDLRWLNNRLFPADTLS